MDRSDNKPRSPLLPPPGPGIIDYSLQAVPDPVAAVVVRRWVEDPEAFREAILDFWPQICLRYDEKRAQRAEPLVPLPLPGRLSAA